MRLTDRPKTLAELRPDFVWPVALQTIMDKVLARDADDRYQSAAQFGREFAAAAAAMTPVRASSGATLMIEAQKAKTPVSTEAVTKAIPATRVSENRDHSATPARSAKPVVAEKKSIVPLAAGGGVVAVVAVVAWLVLGNKPPTSPAAETPPPTVASAPDAGGDGRAQADTTTPAPAGNGTTQQPPVTPQPREQRTETRPPAGGTSAPATPTTTATPPGANVTQLIRDWRTRIETASPDDARRVGLNAIRALEPLVPNLSGIQLDDANYTLMLANVGVDDDAAVCRFSSAVLASRLGEDEKTAANTVRVGRSCQ